MAIIDILGNFQSAGVFLKIIIILAITMLASFLIKKIIRKSWAMKDKVYQKYLSKRIHLKNDIKAKRTERKIIERLISLVVYSIGAIFIIFSIPSLRDLSYSLFAGAGVLALIVGFATQKVFSNLVSGIFIAIFDPFRIGDRIRIKDYEGIVTDLTLRHTVIRTWDGNNIIIPNSIISDEEIINYSIYDEKVLNKVEFGISYDANIDKARKIITKVIKKNRNYIPKEKLKQNELLNNDGVKVIVDSLGDFSVNLAVYFWSRDKGTGYGMSKEILERVKEEFDKNKINIPFPTRVVINRKKQ